ncbi:peroxiredoxin-like family protein [Mycolicibacterium pyrenivorans]|uniref:peroxiredoxin-like family protein n=1 Tax=Mycolicibacterium pyrenivorans TaxID=187102 RepID=UPI0021F3A37B|nr:peroxiredoxin-like family protein [Mycolicibacterium pyrenivorans]MCV7154739.1 AhpC/TSA family protein [Mycolicibacterium pyrenivorans]
MGPASISDLRLHGVGGEPIAVPDPNALVHLQFRRFAGCPICNLHLRSFARRHEEINAAGIREVVFFHSGADELRPHVADLPFAAVADPHRRYYRQFGVEASARALLDPRAWRAIVRGVALTLTGRFRAPQTRQPGGRLGLPADFLVGSDGRVVAAKYGRHADDQWSVDELLTHARTAGPPR